MVLWCFWCLISKSSVPGCLVGHGLQVLLFGGSPAQQTGMFLGEICSKQGLLNTSVAFVLHMCQLACQGRSSWPAYPWGLHEPCLHSPGILCMLCLHDGSEGQMSHSRSPHRGLLRMQRVLMAGEKCRVPASEEWSCRDSSKDV